MHENLLTWEACHREKLVWGKWLVSHTGVLAMATIMGQPRTGPCRHNKAGQPNSTKTYLLGL